MKYPTKKRNNPSMLFENNTTCSQTRGDIFYGGFNGVHYIAICSSKKKQNLQQKLYIFIVAILIWSIV